MSDATKKRLVAVAAILIALGGLGVISMMKMGDSVVYYKEPSDVVQMPKGTVVRLAGMVVANSVQWDKTTHLVTFDLTDGRTTVHVRNDGNPPDMFREGIGAVVEGSMQDDGLFHSTKLIVKHDSSYKPPEGTPSMEQMREMAKSLDQES